MVAFTCNPSILGTETRDCHEFKSNLSYTVISRPVCTILQDPARHTYKHTHKYSLFSQIILLIVRTLLIMETIINFYEAKTKRVNISFKYF